MLLCVFAFGTALIAGFLDQMGIKQLGLDMIIKEESNKIVWFSTHSYMLFSTKLDTRCHFDFSTPKGYSLSSSVEDSGREAPAIEILPANSLHHLFLQHHFTLCC